MIEKGVAWGHEPTGPADVEVAGGDAALAAAVAGASGLRVRFRPDATSDFARALGIATGQVDAAPRVELPCDVLRVTVDSRMLTGVNMAVIGRPPDLRSWWRRWRVATPLHVEVDGRTVHDGHANAVVIANGQYLRGADVVPRGHPGDGRVEVHVYALTPGEWSQLRGRLARGEHLPNPRILVRSGRRVRVTGARPRRTEVDGVVVAPSPREVVVEVAPEAFLLQV